MSEPMAKFAKTAHLHPDGQQPDLDGQPFPWQVVDAQVSRGSREFTTVTFEVVITGQVLVDGGIPDWPEDHEWEETPEGVTGAGDLR